MIRQKLVKNGERLPPVFPIVIYNGETVWSVPLNVRELIEPVHEELCAYQPEQRYFLIDEGRISNRILDDAKGESAYIFRLENATTPAQILAIFHELRERLAGPEFAFLRKSLYKWIGLLLMKRSPGVKSSEIENLENYAMLEERIARWEQEFIKKGMALGKEEGIADQKELLLEMLTRRFYEIPREWEKSIKIITNGRTINDLMLATVTCASIEEFQEALARGTKSDVV